MPFILLLNKLRKQNFSFFLPGDMQVVEGVMPLALVLNKGLLGGIS